MKPFSLPVRTLPARGASLPGRSAVPTLVLLAAALLLAGCQPGEQPDAPPAATPEAAAPAVTELEITVLREGEGAVIESGQTAVVHYTGWLYAPEAEDARGAQFDSSHPRGQPFRFRLGAGQVIRGWDEGVADMRVGEQRQLVIPPDMAYGQRGAGGVIPPNATLLFEVELLEIE
ncbi:MAG: FKBP-type peptidyl-prolyl cis-trans isomerase [Gammaproteobacteria bacterium]|nr:FKBP-type peptidyl-prolyl cis-trans isomerase [Gammaproteobacteria bacterium]